MFIFSLRCRPDFAASDRTQPRCQPFAWRILLDTVRRTFWGRLCRLRRLFLSLDGLARNSWHVSNEEISNSLFFTVTLTFSNAISSCTRAADVRANNKPNFKERSWSDKLSIGPISWRKPTTLATDQILNTLGFGGCNAKIPFMVLDIIGISPTGCPSIKSWNWDIHDQYTPIVRYAKLRSRNWHVRSSRIPVTGVENGHLFLSAHQLAQLFQGPSYRFLVLFLHDAMRSSHTVCEMPAVCIRLLKEATQLKLGVYTVDGRLPGWMEGRESSSILAA